MSDKEGAYPFDVFGAVVYVTVVVVYILLLFMRLLLFRLRGTVVAFHCSSIAYYKIFVLKTRKI